MAELSLRWLEICSCRHLRLTSATSGLLACAGLKVFLKGDLNRRSALMAFMDAKGKKFTQRFGLQYFVLGQQKSDSDVEMCELSVFDEKSVVFS